MQRYFNFSFLVCCLVFFHVCCISRDERINIALHAQVSPKEKVVGSVITTDGYSIQLILYL